MRSLRVEYRGQAHYCSIEDELSFLALDAAPWRGGTPTGLSIPRSEARVLAPLEPSKIVGVGRNYAAHARELGNEVPTEPLIFLKPPSSLCATGDAIQLPRSSERVEHEAEIGIVIGRRLHHASVAQARDAIFGVTCINDVTARDLQRKDVQFTRAKGFDTFCPTGPRVVPVAAGLDPGNLRIVTRVNGQVRQDSTTADMIFDVAAIIEFASRCMTLEEGDLVTTGTPPGVGPLVAGDVVAIEIEGIGVLENPVVDEEVAAA